MNKILLITKSLLKGIFWGMLGVLSLALVTAGILFFLTGDISTKNIFFTELSSVNGKIHVYPSQLVSFIFVLGASLSQMKDDKILNLKIFSK